MRSALFTLDCLVRPTAAGLLRQLAATREADAARALADAIRRAR